MRQSSQPRAQTLIHFTPLRYPGGKAKLAPFVKKVIAQNALFDGMYVEPYAGGCGIGLELLFHEYVTRIGINDISPLIYAFWKSVLDHTDDLCRLIIDTPVTPESWRAQKTVMSNAAEFDVLDVGFATFFLNRTNRSGILNGGMIGGHSQSGAWTLDARYNARELVFRIESIARMRSRIVLTCKDAFDLISDSIWPKKTLIYCDPPYYRKGNSLYYNYYRHKDHVQMAKLMKSLSNRSWIVSYDDDPEIRSMYEGCRSVEYSIRYSARTVRTAGEVMFFSDGLVVPTIR